MIFSLIISPLFSQDAREIIKKAEDNAKGKSSIAEIVIQTERPTWSREMTVKVWTKGSDLTLILIKSPEKEKGVVFLKQKKEVWNWIPSIERNIKLPPSMMSQSWMGTDFTNDDLVKEASILEDYDQSLLGKSTVDGRKCYSIRLDPKPTSSVVWGKVLMEIDTIDYLMLHVEYFDEEGVLINTLHSSNIKSMGGRIIPTKMEMIPNNKEGHKTLMIYKSLLFDIPIQDSFFTVQNMTKVK
jgi:hypothetical protein